MTIVSMTRGDGVRIAESAVVAASKIEIGDRTVIGEDVVIEGRHVVLGRESWLAPGATIGGGSCDGQQASLVAGDFLHMGRGSHINIARKVELGDEVGLGRDTRVYTHGAFLPETEGFPASFEEVKIGSRVWLPAAIVLPGITIGNNVVVAAGSVVNHDLPDGCLAGGVPAKVIRGGLYPTRFVREVDWRSFIEGLECDLGMDLDSINGGHVVQCGTTRFDLIARTIVGPVTGLTERLKNQLRRHGVRFRYRPGTDRRYMPW